jgi:catechol 2,3-dioxygenase-like lactoylglutathione lyase family enzyme
MPRLDHIQLPITDWRRSRNWYCDHLGFQVEFEMPEQRFVAVRDDADLTIFLCEGHPTVTSTGLSFTIQVGDVDAKYAQLSAAGVAFIHPPKKVYWGYGAELLDPDGYRVLLWDEKSMKEKSH